MAVDVLKRAKNPKGAKSILESIVATNLNTIVGPVGWAKGPVRNVSKTPLVSGQWIKKLAGYDLVITNNATAPNIPTGGAIKPLG